MHLPNYNDGSIVNLMGAVLEAYDVKSAYKPLKNLDIDTIRRLTNTILLVIDGLGYEFLMRHIKGTALAEFPIRKITSVFPSTTATAITTFATALAPQQHAITGWFMHLKELGSVVKILPFTPRQNDFVSGFTDTSMKNILGWEPIASHICTDSYFFSPHYLHKSTYTRATSRGAEMIPFDSLSDCLTKIMKTVKASSRKKFIYAYWPELDTVSHGFGTESAEAIVHFKELEQSVTRLARVLKGSRTMILVTSDHGLIDTKEEDLINLNEHPVLSDTLALPLCGEPRVAYCYVRPSRVRKFREYVSTKLKKYCTLHRSQELIKRNFFGLHRPNEKLFDRVGDFVLIMKDNYIIKDFITGETEHFLKANHGGVSNEEMYVPLITISC